MVDSAHRYKAQIAAEDVEVREGMITLNAGRAPHVEATISLPIGYLELLDPRESPRVVITATAVFFTGATFTRQTRVFDLGVRRRPTSLGDAMISVTLASDERLLEDYRPLGDVTATVSMTTIRQVVAYVLNRAIPGAVLAPSGDAPAVGSGADSDALLWKAGDSALQFLQPLVQALGLRLVCDEKRVWTLRNENYTGHGEIHTISHGENLIAGDDEIDRDADLWFDARVTRYSWTDSAGTRQERVDAYALTNPYTRATLLEVNAPYPGDGRSQYAVRRAQQRGRELSATTIANWDMHAEQPAVFTFPETPIQFGAVQTVEYDLSRDEMTITARTIDTPDTAWVLLDADEAWNDSLPGESWTEEIA